MTPQETTQLKALSLQAAAGNLEQAKAVFAWLSEDGIVAEVERRVSQALDSSIPDVFGAIERSEFPG